MRRWGTGAVLLLLVVGGRGLRGDGFGQGHGHGQGHGGFAGQGHGGFAGQGHGGFAGQGQPRLEDPEACRECHEAEVAEWGASRHAAAWRDPIFQSEFARGRPAWCVSCHAPGAADPTAPSDGDPLVAQGIGCAGCHGRGGALVSRRRAAGSPHATVVDPTFGSADFCASCHEFNFPLLGPGGRLERYTDEPMQATVSQWRQSGRAAAVDCIDCHGASPAGHAFRGSHDPAMVADALDIELCRAGGAIEVGISNRGAAHNVPSGGVHRRIVLRAWRPHVPERLAERTLGRRFRMRPGGGKQTVSDTTIPPRGEHRSRFSLDAMGPARPGADLVNLELRYVYALEEGAELPGAVTSRVIWHRAVAPEELPRCVTGSEARATARAGTPRRSARSPRR